MFQGPEITAHSPPLLDQDRTLHNFEDLIQFPVTNVYRPPIGKTSISLKYL